MTDDQPRRLPPHNRRGCDAIRSRRPSSIKRTLQRYRAEVTSTACDRKPLSAISFSSHRHRSLDTSLKSRNWQPRSAPADRDRCRGALPYQQPKWLAFPDVFSTSLVERCHRAKVPDTTVSELASPCQKAICVRIANASNLAPASAGLVALTCLSMLPCR
jgi:hypothetical protein